MIALRFGRRRAIIDGCGKELLALFVKHSACHVGFVFVGGVGAFHACTLAVDGEFHVFEFGISHIAFAGCGGFHAWRRNHVAIASEFQIEPFKHRHLCGVSFVVAVGDVVENKQSGSHFALVDGEVVLQFVGIVFFFTLSRGSDAGGVEHKRQVGSAIHGFFVVHNERNVSHTMLKVDDTLKIGDGGALCGDAWA